MDYEKKYKEALERAKESLKDGGISQNSIDYIQSIFPELAESEDEKIKRELIDYINRLTASPNNIEKYNTWIAWLKKQGEKKIDPRYSIFDKLIEADNIYQMSVNDAMIAEARNKAISALSSLEISKLLGLEKQGERKPAWRPSKAQMVALHATQSGVIGLTTLQSLYNDLEKL